MDLYKDFTFYSYQHFENAYNIGWINENHIKHVNKLDEVFKDNLALFIKKPVNTLRNSNHYVGVVIDGKEYNLGFSEIRVISEDGIKYAAPDMIYYYVTEKGYIPPLEFINAVKNGPKPDTYLYKEFLKRYNKENYWGEIKENIDTIENTIKLLNMNLYESEIKNNIEIVTLEGSLLNYAINHKRKELAEYLIENGIDINKFSGIELANAISNNMIEIIDKLLSKNICVNIYNIKNNPLYIAIKKGNKDIVKKLLNFDKGLDIVYNNEFMKNMDAFKFAQLCNQLDIAKLLKVH